MTVLRFKQAIGRAQDVQNSVQLFFLWIIARSLKSYGKLFLKVTQEVALKHAKFRKSKGVFRIS